MRCGVWSVYFRSVLLKIRQVYRFVFHYNLAIKLLILLLYFYGSEVYIDEMR